MPTDSADRWRLTTFALAFILLLVCVAWVMREQAIHLGYERERAQWEADRQLMVRLREEQSREIERLDLAHDELRREQYHRANPTTTPEFE